MGGCRCTYKNCTIRSDGKTHLFHYPVFDKVRCHEWLSRAGRYDFLNLKVSQLKNRCICQHHFTDDWFMNDKKEKLKSKAVPTLDGPFCDSSKFKEMEMPQNMLGLYPLACEVVENDDFVLDRKSNYNLLYADFLTNDAMMDYKIIDEDSKNLINIENVTPFINNNIAEVFTHKTQGADISKPTINQINKTEKDVVKEIIFEVPLLTNQLNNAIVTKKEFPPQNEVEEEKPLLQVDKKKSKVRIISEKKITEPEKRICVPVSAAAFEVVKPSMILSINKNKPTIKANNTLPQVNKVKEGQTFPNISPTILNNVEKNVNNVEKNLNNVEKNVNNVVDEIIMSFNNDKDEPIVQSNMDSFSKQKESNIIQIFGASDPSKFNNQIKSNEPKPLGKQMSPLKQKERNKLPIIKNQMSPERVAAINEKRKFNMRLKDIIAEELNRLDEQASVDKDILVPKKKIKTYESGSERVRSSLAEDPSLPNEHAYIVHYLEARMEKMENLLLNKIDQNTKKIMDLKKTLETKEDDEPLSKKVSTKSNSSEDAHKKQLYKEISKYLTPNCNSLLYEELFINKFDPNEAKAAPAPAKRKRNR